MTDCGCIWWGNQHGHGIRMCEEHSQVFSAMCEAAELEPAEMLDHILRRYLEMSGAEAS